jgi:serine/threonine protein kinase
VSAQEIPQNPIWNASGDDSGNCLPVGTRLADFEITGIVGEGGFGIVYMAFDHALQRTVAIKEYMPGSLAGRGSDHSVVIRSPNNQETFQAGLKSFINEARLLAQFDHPALIKVYQFWEQNKTAYMAMRYYEGQTLKSIIKNHPEMVTEAWLKAMLGPILEALESLYQVQVLHRDISPDNIMIQKKGGAVLLDFGAARQIIGDLTQALTVILKPGYAPIEQYADDTSMKQGPWTDIYALSAVIYSAVVKKTPPTSIARIIRDPIEQLRNGSYATFSQEFLSAVDKGLSVKSEDRPQTIEEFRNLLGIDTFTINRTDIGTISMIAPLQTAAAQTAIQSGQNQAVPANPTVTLAIPALQQANNVKQAPVHTPPVQQTPQMQQAQPEPAKTGKRASDRQTVTGKSGSPKTIWIIVAVAATLAVGGIGLAGYQLYSKVISPTIKPKVPTPPVQPPVSAEASTWEAIKNSNNSNDFAKFLEAYPESRHFDVAQARMAELKEAATKAAAAEQAKNAEEQAKQAAAEQAKAAETMGFVKLNIRPKGNIEVDGVAQGATPPLKQLPLAEGKHQIKVTSDKYPDYVVEVDVVRQKTVNVSHNFAPRAQSQSTPAHDDFDERIRPGQRKQDMDLRNFGNRVVPDRDMQIDGLRKNVDELSR